MVFYPRSHSSMYLCSKICRIGDVWSVSAPRLYALSLRGAIVRFCTKKLQTFTSPCITSFQRSRTSSERWLCISTGNVAPTDAQYCYGELPLSIHGVVLRLRTARSRRTLRVTVYHGSGSCAPKPFERTPYPSKRTPHRDGTPMLKKINCMFMWRQIGWPTQHDAQLPIDSV